MTPQRELRYYASISKLLLLLIACGLFVVGGLQVLREGGNASAAWLAIGFFGLCALVALAMLVFAIFLRRPLLVIDARGITVNWPLMLWKTFFVPWSDIAYIGIRTRGSARGATFSTFQAQVRDPNRYSSPRVQGFIDRYDPTLQGMVIGVPFTFLFLWDSRKRRVALLKGVQQTFAPEIARYGIVVDDVEQLV